MTWRGWLRLVVLAIEAPLVPAALIHIWANGPRGDGVFVLIFCALLAILGIWLPSARSRRWIPALFTLLLLPHTLGWIELALFPSIGPSRMFSFCIDGHCPPEPPIIGRWTREGQTARAGLYLARLLGMIHGAEFTELEGLLIREYGALNRSELLRYGPDAIMLGFAGGRVRYFKWVPPDRFTGPAEPSERTDLPCLIFLHGFGGQLSAYLNVLIDSPLGREMVILAPSLGFSGQWWQGDGPAVVKELVDRYLPRQVDRDRVFLMGLSNGAVGATAMATSAAMGHRFRGTILISGIDGPSEHLYTGADLLAISGSRDDRFPISYLREQAVAIREAGIPIQLEVLDASHMLLLSHKEQVTALMKRWIDARMQEKHASGP